MKWKDGIKSSHKNNGKKKIEISVIIVNGSMLFAKTNNKSDVQWKKKWQHRNTNNKSDFPITNEPKLRSHRNYMYESMLRIWH